MPDEARAWKTTCCTVIATATRGTDVSLGALKMTDMKMTDQIHVRHFQSTRISRFLRVKEMY